MDAAIARIERLNPTINALVTPAFEQTRQAALNGVDGPLAGVQTLVASA